MSAKKRGQIVVRDDCGTARVSRFREDAGRNGGRFS